MDEREFPDNKTLLKRALVLFLIVGLLFMFLFFIKTNIHLAISALVIIISVFLLVLFVRLCFDIHAIRKNMEGKNAK